MSANQPFQYYPFSNYPPFCISQTIMFPGYSLPFFEMEHLRASSLQIHQDQDKLKVKHQQSESSGQRKIVNGTNSGRQSDEDVSEYNPNKQYRGSKVPNRQISQVPKDKKSEKEVAITNNRNMNSNLLRVFFRRLQLKLKNERSIISKITGKYKMKISVQDFLDWYSRNKINHRNYIRISSVQKLFICQHFCEEETKVMRILLEDFIKNEAAVCFLTSKKVGKDEATNNFLAFRTIIQTLIQIQ